MDLFACVLFKSLAVEVFYNEKIHDQDRNSRNLNLNPDKLGCSWCSLVNEHTPILSLGTQDCKTDHVTKND